jgi:hypothetical protein
VSRERVRLIHRNEHCPDRINIGMVGTIVRYDEGKRSLASSLAFVRWDNGDRSWHPAHTLESLDARDQRRAA